MKLFKLQLNSILDEEIIEEVQKRSILKIIQLLAVPLFLYYAVHCFELHLSVLALLSLICAASVLFGFFLTLIEMDPAKRNFIFRIYVYFFFIHLLVMHVIVCYQGLIAYMGWFFIYPLVAYFTLGVKEGLLFSSTHYISIAVALLLNDRLSSQVNTIENFKVHLLLALISVNTIAFTNDNIRSFIQHRLIRNQSKLKRSEKVLRKSKERTEKLATQLMELNQDLKCAMDQANEKAIEARKANRAKSQFLANMSHELRTPLNHIIGFTELVADQKIGEISELQKEYLTDVLSSSRHLLMLINDILDLSKVEAGKMELILSRVDVLSMLNGCQVMFEEKTRKHAIDFVLETAAAPAEVVADEMKLKQILYNLLSNAFKYTPDGGRVNVTSWQISGDIRSRPGGLVNPEQYSDSKKWAIAVTDSGIGIASKDLENIFNPFEQIINDENSIQEGTGLGLALTRRMVELHGGVIWAESNGHGQGATFIIMLPELSFP